MMNVIQMMIMIKIFIKIKILKNKIIKNYLLN